MSIPAAVGLSSVDRLPMSSRPPLAGGSPALRRAWSGIRRLLERSVRRPAGHGTVPAGRPDAPAPDAAAVGAFPQYAALLATYLGPQRGRVALLSLLLLVGTALELAGPRVLGRFVDAAVAAAPSGALLDAALLFVALTLLTQGLAVATASFGEGVAWTATNALRADLMWHCLRQDLAFHTRHSPGELIERIDGDVTALAGFFTEFVVRVVGTGLLAAGVLVLAGLEDWRVGAALVAYAVVSVAVLARVQGVGVPRFIAARRAAAAFSAYVEERLAGLEDIQGVGAGADALRGLAERSGTLLRRARTSQLMGSVVATTSVGLFALGTGLVFALGALFVSRGQMTVGAVYVLFRYVDLLTFNLRVLTLQLDDLQRAVAGVARIRELYGAAGTSANDSRRIDDGQEETLPAEAPALTFEGVTYAYPGTGGDGDGSRIGTPAVRDLDVSVEPGETLGIVGRTGSGKTTVGRLLFRLCDPDAGAVRLGGVDVRRVALAELRRCVGYVPQEVQLLRASVRDNVTLFATGIADADIERAFAALGLWSWYRALPRGLDEPLAPGGGASAGEAQLLALTRTFLRRPRVVVLDEVSARLDPATERLLDGALGRLLGRPGLRGVDAGMGGAAPEGRRTGVVIAHRPVTLRHADRIIVLEGGCVVARHRRQDLGADGLAALLAAAGHAQYEDPGREGGGQAGAGRDGQDSVDEASIQPGPGEPR